MTVGQASTCTATVSDTDSGTKSVPSGTVSFSTDSGGSFGPGASCTLAATGNPGEASCSVSYAPSTVGSGTHVIIVTYGADATHAGSTAAANVGVSERPTPTSTSTSTSVSCVPGSVAVGNATSCTATVTDTGSGPASTPTGTVSFSSSGAGGFGAGGSCALLGSGASVSCQVSYTPSAVGLATHTIIAGYGGDGSHTTSSGNTTLAVSAPAGGGPAKDADPPLVALSGELAQSVKLGYVYVNGRSNEDATVEGRGTVAPPPPVSTPRTAAAAKTKTKTYRLRSTKATVKAGKKFVLKLRLTKKTIKTVKQGLSSGRRSTARVTIVATDAAGNKRTVKRQIKIKN